MASVTAWQSASASLCPREVLSYAQFQLHLKLAFVLRLVDEYPLNVQFESSLSLLPVNQINPLNQLNLVNIVQLTQKQPHIEDFV